MINNRFEAYKVKREIIRSGNFFDVKRPSKNRFGEPTDDFDYVTTINGIYHEENSFITIKTGEATQIRNKKSPKILCLYDDIKDISFDVDDVIYINGKMFKISAITNIAEWSIIADVSMEEVVCNVTKN